MTSLSLPIIDISVIIPCYNSGKYLTEAIESVEAYEGIYSYEIIIINDGSTESKTIALLNKLAANTNFIIIHQENKGPAAARNTGVKNSKGKHLLFLDSDNKIRTEYIDKGIEVLSIYKNVGVVYGNPFFYGESTGRNFIPKEFSLKTILFANYIDTCTVIRRKVWEDVGGFDEDRELSQEDWEFWIRVGKTNWKFYHINEILFEYRVRNDSHVTSSYSKAEYRKLLKYVYTKHMDLFIDNYILMNYELEIYERDSLTPIRTFVKLLYKKIINRKNA
ncbi:glycosyltransferase family A protein [uncultured Mucilaginibacter sp.]|uniref:glycosyltransferase family 2 protein n=1 Tax=uncultured Mucilaginibacter sp. TaxID=797541 RepID=UPI002619DDE8|nr:glycosyltransferase family A protein [uncultured Mucilaginibacter sp.]